MDVVDRRPIDFFIYSRPAIERVPPHDVPHIIISITTTEDDRARIPASDHCRGILRLAFVDAEDAVDGHEENELFSVEHADRIWDFVRVHRRNISRVVLHCDAGVSRSPGVAAALAKALVGDDSEYFARYHPNMRVYRTMLARHHDRLSAAMDET